MNKTESIKNVAAALIKFNAKVSRISKDAKNPFHKNTYSTLDQIVDEVRPVLNENGLSVMQNVSGNDGSVTVKTILLHESGEYIESSGTTLKLAKNDPQGAGAGITYARRYDLCAFLSLNTGDDDDGNSTSNLNNKPSKASSKQLDLVDKLLNKKVTEKHTKEQLYQHLKNTLKTQTDMENWTSQQASQAIKILQGDNK